MLGNDLTGSIPPELGNLHNLDALLLGGNRLSGPIPPELGALSRLRVLMLSDNPLTGAIPPELGGLTQLQGLHLDGDHLSGPVPPELGSLAELRKLYISNNDLDGRVPDAFLNLDLDEFWWHNNPLCLPATPAFEAWRRRIPLTRGAYCAAGAAAAVEGTGALQITKPITVELVVPCTVRPGSGANETGELEQAEHMIWTGSGAEVSLGASISCAGNLPSRPWAYRLPA